MNIFFKFQSSDPSLHPLLSVIDSSSPETNSLSLVPVNSTAESQHRMVGEPPDKKKNGKLKQLCGELLILTTVIVIELEIVVLQKYFDLLIFL